MALTIEMGFEGMDFDPVQRMCEEIGVEYIRIKTDIKEVVFDVRQEENPCSLCSKMRRGAINNAMKEHGCNKLALGHHFDDAIETLLMSMMYSSEIKTMMPKLKSLNFENMELIRPLYKVPEREIIAWSRYNELRFLQCACRFTERSEEHEDLSKRRETKRLISELRKTNPEVDKNLFRSMHNVNIGSLPAYRESDGKEIHSFLEDY